MISTVVSFHIYLFISHAHRNELLLHYISYCAWRTHSKKKNDKWTYYTMTFNANLTLLIYIIGFDYFQPLAFIYFFPFLAVTFRGSLSLSLSLSFSCIMHHAFFSFKFRKMFSVMASQCVNINIVSFMNKWVSRRR